MLTSYFELEKFACFCFVLFFLLLFIFLSVCASVMAIWRYLSTSWSVVLLTSVTFKILMSCVAHNLFDFSDWMLVSSIDFGHRTGDNCMFCLLNVLILSSFVFVQLENWHQNRPDIICGYHVLDGTGDPMGERIRTKSRHLVCPVYPTSWISLSFRN